MLKAPDGDILEDVNDKFEIVTPAASTSGRVQERSAVVGRFGDNEALVKTIIVHQDSPPSIEETPYFNHQTFYASLQHYNKGRAPDEEIFGFHLLYSEVVTSTNTLLEKYADQREYCHINTNALQKHQTFTTSANRLYSDGHDPNSWQRPRLKCLGVTSWLLDVFDSDSPFYSVENTGAHNILTIPGCHCNSRRC